MLNLEYQRPNAHDAMSEKIEFTAADHAFMAQALRVAQGGLRLASPNPAVGCVLVREGQVLGVGHTLAPGQNHAEIQALKDCQARGQTPAGATAYVTLEPCAHFGRTPPCAQALIDAGLERVVAALQDPFPAVAGRGLSMLQQAGIATALGLLADEAREWHGGFLSRIQRQRPRIRLKIAASLDGRTALASGESQWITGPEARQDVQRWRARADAILTGIGTVLADDPRLTVREGEGAARPQPLRVVLDSHLRLPPQARLFQEAGGLLVVCAQDHPQAWQVLAWQGAEVLCLPDRAGRVDLTALCAELARRGINDVLVEAGAALNGAWLQSGLVDEIVLYQAPVLLGGESRSMADFPLARLADCQVMTVRDVRAVGRDWRWQLRLEAATMPDASTPLPERP